MELGAGTGVVGLTLGRLGAAPVVITDNEPELVTLMAKNIEASGIGGIGRNLESLDWKFGHAFKSVQANELGDRVHTALLDWADQTTFMQELPEIVVAAVALLHLSCVLKLKLCCSGMFLRLHTCISKL